MFTAFYWVEYSGSCSRLSSASHCPELDNPLYTLPFSFFSTHCNIELPHMTITWCFSDRASWIDYILITNLMHWLIFIHKILFSTTCFEPQVLIFRRIQLYTCSIWYCHSLWEFLVACRYTAWVRTHSSCVPTSYQKLWQYHIVADSL